MFAKIQNLLTIFIIYISAEVLSTKKANRVFLSYLASTPIMEQAPKNVTVLDGKDATIICRAVGAPTPNITWTYNSKYSIVVINIL